MSITLDQLNDEFGSLVHAQVRHGGNAFAALVNGSRESLQQLLGQECLVEMSFEQIVNWREIAEFEDESACIKASPTTSGAVMIRGRVHNILPVNFESSVVDLYLKTGPEFLAIDSKALGGFVPAVDSALEIHVLGLCFYPVCQRNAEG